MAHVGLYEEDNLEGAVQRDSWKPRSFSKSFVSLDYRLCYGT